MYIYLFSDMYACIYVYVICMFSYLYHFFPTCIYTTITSILNKTFQALIKFKKLLVTYNLKCIRYKLLMHNFIFPGAFDPPPRNLDCFSFLYEIQSSFTSILMSHDSSKQKLKCIPSIKVSFT